MMSTVRGFKVQSTVRGSMKRVMISGRSATFKSALAVCTMDPLVNPHSYVPGENTLIQTHGNMSRFLLDDDFRSK